MNLIEKLTNYVKEKGAVLTINDWNDETHQHSLWFGGTAATITYKGNKLEISAIGDVRAWLFDENGEEVARVKDKANNGNFYSVMYQYIESDEKLVSLRDTGRLVIDDGNWWEVFVDDSDCTESVELDAMTLSEAIMELADSLDEFCDWFEPPVNPEDLRPVTIKEFLEFNEGDTVYVRCRGAVPEYSKATVVRAPFWNSDADEPGWEIETTNCFSDVYSIYVKKENYNER